MACTSLEKSRSAGSIAPLWIHLGMVTLASLNPSQSSSKLMCGFSLPDGHLSPAMSTKVGLRTHVSQTNSRLQCRFRVPLSRGALPAKQKHYVYMQVTS